MNNKDGTDIGASVTPVDVPLVSPVIQVRPGPARVLLANGTAQVITADTAVNGGGLAGPCGPKSVCRPLEDTGVPFVYVDGTPRNNFRYFYSVTAFDVNSFQSGNSSLESPRSTKAVTPVSPASNYSSSGSISSGVMGRGVRVDSLITAEPTLDPTTGQFSGPFPPADGGSLAFVGQFVTPLFAAARDDYRRAGGFDPRRCP